MDFASPLPHPGEILREDFMEPMGLTAGALARAMGLKDRTRIERLSREKQPVTADTAARLSRVFGNSAQFWLNLQSQHDLSVVEIAEREQLVAIHILPQMERRSAALSDEFASMDAVGVAVAGERIKISTTRRRAPASEPAAALKHQPGADVPFAGDLKRKPLQKTKR